MRAILTLLVLSLLVISVVPGVFATDIGTGIGVDIVTEDFEPLVWMCDDRVVYDDHTEPGRLEIEHGSLEGVLVERLNNYAFEGEQIKWTVLVMDKNGIEKVNDVYATAGSTQGAGNEAEVNCQKIFAMGIPNWQQTCNARILEEQITTFDPNTMAFFECTFTVEPSDSMYGEYWLTVEAEDNDGLLGTADENEYWYLNPVIGLSIDGDLTFENVRPGTSAYSETLLVGNDADAGSGVMMDMFISGTDFYDSESSVAMCPTSNQLSLGAFSYLATSGAYSTRLDPRSDSEGYVGINYGERFNNDFYDANEILQTAPPILKLMGVYYGANLLAPGAEHALTFRLKLPEPCNGDFDLGTIYFWGEAV